jgi:general secretion pathway protein D
MDHRRLKYFRFSNRVPEGQGSPQAPASGPGAVPMPGSRMNHRTPLSTVRVPLFRFPLFRGPLFRTAVLAALALAPLSFAVLPAAAESANSDYKQGQAAEGRQDYDTAFADYQKAWQKDPKDLRYQTAFYRVRVSAAAAHIAHGRQLFQSGDMQGALTEFLHANEIDPSDEEAQQEITLVRQKQGQNVAPAQMAVPELASEQSEVDTLGPPAQLKPISTEPLTLHMTQDTKIIYQAIGKAAGINVLFDPDYNSKRLQVDLNNVTLLDALRIVGTMSNTFWRPVTDNTIFVAQNTRIKRSELDEQAVQTFYLANAWQQNDLNDVQTALRNVLLNAKVYGVQSQNAIVVRGTPDELLLAQKLIDDLDKPRAEVVVDTAVLEVSKNWERTLGISWPSSVGVQLQTSSSSNSSNCASGSTDCTSSTVSPTLYDLAHLKASDFAVTVGSATLNLLLTDDNTQILQDPRIRSTDGQKADLKIGSRIPIATGSYQTGAATALVSSLVNTQFQYQDVGVEIEVTPSVHYDNDVTLKLKITVSAESGTQTISGVTEPIISQRVVDQVIRLKEGEASIIGGIQNNQEQQNWNGIPGLSSIPILKYIFGSKDHMIQNDEIVFVVVPHVVRSQDINQQNLRAVDTGSGQSIDLRHVSLPQSSPEAMLSRAVRSNAMATVPSQSADTAAPAAMAQMSAAQQQSFAMAQGAQTAPAGLAPSGAPPVRPQAVAPPGTGAPPGAGLAFSFNAPTAPLAQGATFEVPVVVSGAANVASVPLQMHYDPARLALVNVAEGGFLSRDGQAAALIHRDDGQGNLTIVSSRPPGAPGMNGSGVVCVLTFRAKTAGAATLATTNASVVTTAGQSAPAGVAQASVTIR